MCASTSSQQSSLYMAYHRRSWDPLSSKFSKNPSPAASFALPRSIISEIAFNILFITRGPLRQQMFCLTGEWFRYPPTISVQIFHGFWPRKTEGTTRRINGIFLKTAECCEWTTAAEWITRKRKSESKNCYIEIWLFHFRRTLSKSDGERVEKPHHFIKKHEITRHHILVTPLQKRNDSIEIFFHFFF